jgi:hypothetical protein
LEFIEGLLLIDLRILGSHLPSSGT